MRKSAGRFASREGQRMRSAGLGQVLPTRKRDFKVVSAVNTAQRVQDAVKVGLDCGPTRSWQNKDGQLSYREVLLIAQVLVRGNEHIESFFCSSQEISIAQIRPSHFERSGDGMTAQDFAQWDRSALIVSTRLCSACSNTATTCSRVTPGNHFRKSFTLAPPSRFSNNARTGARVPLNTQAPLTFPGMRSTALH